MAVARADIHFLAACAVSLAVLFNLLRINGLAILLIVTLITRLKLTPAALLLLLGLAITIPLQKFGNWYAAHLVVKLLAVLATMGVVVMTAPAWLCERLAQLRPLQVAIFGVALPAYGFLSFTNGSIHTGDTRPVLPTVVQMLRHGNRDLATWNAQNRWLPYVAGQYPYFLRSSERLRGLYSAYPAGMELFALPAATMLVLRESPCTEQQCTYCERITARALTAAMLALFYLLATHFVRPWPAYLATILLATSSTLTSSSSLSLWQQDGVTFWMLVVLLCEVRGLRGWLPAFACAAMLSCRPSAITFLVPFGVWLLLQNWRSGCGLVARALVCYLPWAMMYQWHYGTPFGPSMGFLKESWQFAEHIPGVLASPGRGFLVYQPWWVLLFALRRPLPAWSWFLGAVLVLHTLLIASWPMWWGGHCYGSRLMMELAPLLGLLILRPLQLVLEQPWGGWLVGGLIALGLMLHLPGAFGNAAAWNVLPRSVDQFPERLWDWRHPPFLFDGQQN